MMRILVLLLAALAGAKVWFQDSVFRSGAEEALLAAYQTRAVEACRREPQRNARGETLAAFMVDWTHPASIQMTAGDRSVPVHLWEVDNPLWDVRFKNPHLVLASGDTHSRLACAFDVLTGEARLVRF